MITFEERCAVAKTSLLQLRETVRKIAEEDLIYLHKRIVVRRGMSEVAENLLIENSDVVRTTITAASQKTMEVMWEGGIAVLNDLCGPDAVEFSLKTMEIEGKEN